MARVSDKMTFTQDFVNVRALINRLQENVFDDMPMEYISVNYLYDIINDMKVSQEVEIDWQLVDSSVKAN